MTLKAIDLIEFNRSGMLMSLLGHRCTQIYTDDAIAVFAQHLCQSVFDLWPNLFRIEFRLLSCEPFFHDLQVIDDVTAHQERNRTR